MHWQSELYLFTVSERIPQFTSKEGIDILPQNGVFAGILVDLTLKFLTTVSKPGQLLRLVQNLVYQRYWNSPVLL